ncbi:MAG TPA: hypothetical protein VIW03_14105 [Anaeromyxobacter sp.]
MLAPSIALLAALAALATPPAAPAPRPDVEASRALGTISAGEPGIADVQEAAAREVERDGSQIEGFPRRSRLAALLPRLTAEYRREERSYRVVGLQGSAEVDYLRFNPGTAFVLRATWELGTLVAARGEIAAAQAAAARAQRREAAVKRATAVFFERRRAMLALLLEPPASALARAEAELALDRLTAELEALTGGLLARGPRR